MSQRLEKFYKYLNLYQKLVKSNAGKFVGSQLAEDVSQETFLRMYERIDYLTDDTVKRWLIVVSGNIAKDYIKKGGKYETTAVSKEIMEEYMSGSEESAEAKLLKAEEQKAALELLRTACELLYEKNPIWYYVMLDSCYLGMSSAEIAKLLKLTTGNVDVIKSRARTYLRKKLGKKDSPYF